MIDRPLIGQDLDDPDDVADAVVAGLADLFARRGAAEYLGEPVTIAEHMLQAATLAERGGLDDATIVAALLHDIGHFLSDVGGLDVNDVVDRRHEEAGARALEPYFPPAVTECVRHHVAAKRYLCATRPDYFARLSEASIRSLKLQGGPMSAPQAAAFAAHPHLKQILQLRYLDEAGKRTDLRPPDFTHFAPKLRRMVKAHLSDA